MKTITAVKEGEGKSSRALDIGRSIGYANAERSSPLSNFICMCPIMQWQVHTHYRIFYTPGDVQRNIHTTLKINVHQPCSGLKSLGI